MASFNYSTMQMTAKVVYYGPGLCGKTTNLQYIFDHTAGNSRGQMVSLETQTDRTLFFDLLPIEVGTIAGFSTRIQLYTVPGQVFYNTTRKLVLKGVDGVVFVADSQRPMLTANVESFKNLGENLNELGIEIGAIPLVVQYNKRDLPDVCSVEELDQALDSGSFPRLEASAITGRGVFETLRAVSKVTLKALKKQLEEGPAEARGAGSPGRSPSTRAPADKPEQPAPSASVTTAAKPVAAVTEATEAVAVPTDRVAAAAKPSVPVASSDGRERSVLVSLPALEFQRARRVTVDLRVEDAEQRTVREVRDVSMDVDPKASPEEMLVQLRIRLGMEDQVG
jgi:signal recognition particle receptor subunit beta